LKRKINKRQIWLCKKTVIIIITETKKLIEPAAPLIQQMTVSESHIDFQQVLPSLHCPLVPVNE
jgi:hypothetical protein